MLLNAALSACDADLRMNLLNHVVLTGGGSLLQGFADRLNTELTRQFGNVRVLFAYTSDLAGLTYKTASETSGCWQYLGEEIWRMVGWKHSR